MVAEGDYKTAGERLAQGEMSTHEREQLVALLGARQRLLEQALTQPRERGAIGAVPAERADALFERVFFSATDAVAAGLIDQVCYEDGLPAVLGEGDEAHSEQATRCWDARRYLGMAEISPWRPVRPRPYLALVPIRGVIRRSPDWNRGGLLRPSTSLAGAIGALRRVRKDKRAVGVLLYVDSPGGSALVSDLIHREVEMLARDKPLVAFFGSVAASGGYYVAAPARHIVAAPEAITGSIGVITVKVAVERLLDRLRIGNHVVATAPHADMFSFARTFSEKERELVATHTRTVYDGFLDVVAEGRGQTREEVEAVAGGRVWSAQEALERDLVDELGDLELALERLRAAIDLPVHVQARLRPRVAWPVDKAPPSPPPQAARACAAELLSTLSLGSEGALLNAAVSDGDPVLCLSLPALRFA